MGQVLFVLYVINKYDKVKFHDLGVDFNADDNKLYIEFNPATKQSLVISKIGRFIKDITSFINLNYLKQNIDQNNFYSKTMDFKHVPDEYGY